MRRIEPRRILYILGLTLPLVAGAWLRLHGLGTLPLNFDEGATFYFAHLPFADLWGKPALLETNPPLYYSIQRCVVLMFGGSAFILRLASVAAGVSSIGVAASLARRLGGRAAGVAAALLVASSAVCVATSQDARTYAVLGLAALVAIAAELRLFAQYGNDTTGFSWRQSANWAAYVCACIAALYLHNTAIVMLAALNGLAALTWLTSLRRQPRFALHWIGANGVIAIVYAFWLPVVFAQSVHTLADFWLKVPTLADLRFATLNIYAQPYIFLLQPGPDLIFIAAGLAGMAVYGRRPGVAGLAIFVLAGVPALSWAISQWRPIMNGKTLIWLTPVFLVFVALGCTRMRRLAWPLTLALVLLQLIACANFLGGRFDEAYPDIAATLRAEAQPGDAIFIDPTGNAILLDVYGWPRERLTVLAPALRDRWFRTFDGIYADEASLPRLHARRLWTLTRALPDVQRAIEAELASTMTEVSSRAYGHGKVRNMTLRNLRLSLFIARDPGGMH